MQPASPRDFLKVAQQRLDVAIDIAVILRRTLEAQYIGGYAVKCSFKALIVARTRVEEREAMLQQLTHGAQHHQKGRLRDLGVALTPELAKRMRRFDWTTDLRYETGRRDTAETNALLKTAESILLWEKQEIP